MRLIFICICRLRESGFGRSATKGASWSRKGYLLMGLSLADGKGVLGVGSAGAFGRHSWFHSGSHDSNRDDVSRGPSSLVSLLMRG